MPGVCFLCGGGIWFASNHFKSGSLAKQRIIPPVFVRCLSSLWLSSVLPPCKNRARSGLGPVFVRTAAQMIWALSRFCESFGLPVEQNCCDPWHQRPPFVFFFPNFISNVFEGGGVGEVSEREGGEGRGLMPLSVTSSVYTRYDWYDPTLALPRRVSGKVLWVWGFSCVCMCVGLCVRVWCCLLLLLLLLFFNIEILNVFLLAFYFVVHCYLYLSVFICLLLFSIFHVQ